MDIESILTDSHFFATGILDAVGLGVFRYVRNSGWRTFDILVYLYSAALVCQAILSERALIG